MPENSIIAELEKRAQNKDNQTVEHQLCELLGDIIQFSTHHLTRVQDFFGEFDDHSVSHSEHVLEYVANLIGKKRLPKLSVYDLFFLAAAAYVHDWGMAPTDYEKEVLLLAEEQPLPANIPTVSDCKAIINRNKETVFANKKKDAPSLPILPNKEEALIKYLAQLYYDYLDFRNGYTEDYRKLSDEADEKKKNKSITAFNQSVRVEYLRKTHAQRSSDYISNWRLPKEPLQNGDLFTALASVVSAHVEPFSTVDALDHKKTFPPVDDQDDSNVANLQFCAMLLRIGDVVHFSYDRAPAVIRKEKIFASAYSEQQWQVKKNVTVQVSSSGKVRFQAFCPTPQQYGFLQTYIGFVNDEIDHFNALAPHWPERYQQQLKHVDNQVKAENNAFETRPDLKFILNPNKIIQLLMGEQLYSDPYTCLRELYQNALDACRCVIPMREHYGENNPQCTIEFGVKEDDGGRYLYCLDNGKGMSKHIIEHFFLNIGSSYYKSKEFYTQWAKDKAGFTPTSQFGIGILSCFMLGTRLEVLTQEYKGKDGLIYFGVDGPQEMFYYWRNERIPDEDKEIFSRRQSGTLVKVYLKKEYANNLECGPLEKLELLKCIDPDDEVIASIEDDKYRNLFNRWQRHIYNHVFDFVQIPFPNIAVQVRVGDQLLPIDPRPAMAKVGWQEYEQDAEMLKRLRDVFGFEWHKNTHSIAYPIVFDRPTYHFHSMLCLPTREDETFQYNSYESAATCVDGVQIEGDLTDGYDMVDDMQGVGIFNFVGPQKPQITVDRREFVNKVPIDDMEALCSDYVGKVYQITKEHISGLNIPADSSFCGKIWRWVIEREANDRLQWLLLNHFDAEGYPSFDVKTPMGKLPLPQLMSMKEIILPYDNVSKYRKDNLFLIKKLSAVKSYTIAENGDLHLTFTDPQTMTLIKGNRFSFSVGLSEDKGLFEDYDMVSSFLPLASHRQAKADESSVKLDSGALLTPGFDLNDFIPHLRNKLFGLDNNDWSKIGQTQINSKEIIFYKYNHYGKNHRLFLTGYIPEPNSDYSNTESGYSFFGIERFFCVVKGRLKRAEMEEIYKQVPEEYRYHNF